MNGSFNIGDIVLNNWRLVRLLGEGSYGKVFEAERCDFGEVFRSAIKIITFPKSPDEIASMVAEGMTEESIPEYYKEAVKEITQEFTLLAALRGNSNIVSYEDHVVLPHDDGIGWDIIIRMELLKPFSSIIKSSQLTRRDVVQLGIDICSALEICRRHNIIHRDIKPDNIFRSEEGSYKLGDFGVARTIEKTIGSRSVKGTFTYMAPEVYLHKPYGPSVDIYSLGIVLYCLLNDNRAPFLPPYPAPLRYSDREAGLVRRMSGEQIPFPAKDNSDLGWIVLKACSYDPDERYNDPADMRKALQAVLGSAANSEEREESEEECTADPADMQRETVYQRAAIMMSKALTPEEYGNAAALFSSVSGYKNADALKRQCLETAAALSAKEKKHDLTGKPQISQKRKKRITAVLGRTTQKKNRKIKKLHLQNPLFRNRKRFLQKRLPLMINRIVVPWLFCRCCLA